MKKCNDSILLFQQPGRCGFNEKEKGKEKEKKWGDWKSFDVLTVYANKIELQIFAYVS